MKIVIAPDKFKGSLSAAEAAEAIARGFRRVFPDAEIECRPIADGGEGTARALCDALNGDRITRTVRGPLGAPVEAGYAWISSPPDGRGPMAIIEMSAASGLALVPEPERRPREANTYGTGELMRDAMERGATRIVVGLGGSATTDGGAGMAAALGYRFFTHAGKWIEHPSPANLLELERIERNGVSPLPEIIAACDVQNPLLGPRGCATIFAPQKGASPHDVEAMELALSRLAERALADLKDSRECHEIPGAGAAGGLGYGLLAFCNATIRPGFDLVAEILDLEHAIRDADLIITGEGSLDTQTLEGKGPAGVAELARKFGKPVIGFGGRVAREPRLLELFDSVIPIPDSPITLPQAIAEAAELLEIAAERAAALCRVGARI